MRRPAPCPLGRSAAFLTSCSQGLGWDMRVHWLRQANAMQVLSRLRLAFYPAPVCMDGSKQEGAVKGAVNEFAEAHGLSILVTYK